MRRTTSRPGTWCAVFCAANAVKAISATFCAGDPRPGGLVADGVGVLDRGPRGLLDAGDRGLGRGSQPDGDRHVGAAGQHRPDGRATEERGVHPDQDRPVRPEQAAGLFDGVADQPGRAAG